MRSLCHQLPGDFGIKDNESPGDFLRTYPELEHAQFRTYVLQIEKDSIPRENPILHLLLRMLYLGLSAWQMIDAQEFAEPKLDLKLVTKFIPCLMSLIVDDQVSAFYESRNKIVIILLILQVRGIISKLPPDEKESAHSRAIVAIEHSG